MPPATTAGATITTLNGVAVRTRPCASLAAATLFSTAPEIMFKGVDAEGFTRLRGAVKLTRYGADCYAYAQLASGFIDLVVEGGLKPYDYCALVPVIEGAGGVITDWQGGALAKMPGGCELRFGFNPWADAPDEARDKVSGEKEFLSSDPNMRASKPTVSEIILSYPQ